MSGRYKKILFFLSILLASGVLILFLTLQILLRSDWLRRQAETQISAVLATPVEVGSLHARFMGPIQVEGLRVLGPLGEKHDFFRIGRVEIHYNWRELLKGQLGSIVLVEPQLFIQRDAEGKWVNIPPGLLEESDTPFIIPEISIERGSVSLLLPEKEFRIAPLSLSLVGAPSHKDERRLRLVFQGKVDGLEATLVSQGEIWQEKKDLGGDVLIKLTGIDALRLQQWLSPWQPESFLLTRGTGEVDIHLNYTPQQTHVQSELSISDVEVLSGTHSLRFDSLHLRGNLTADEETHLNLKSLEIDFASLGKLVATGEMNLSSRYLNNLSLKADDWNLSQIRETLADWYSPPLQMDGLVDWSIEANGLLDQELNWNAVLNSNDLKIAFSQNDPIQVGVADDLQEAPSIVWISEGLDSIQIQAVGRSRFQDGTSWLDHVDVRLGDWLALKASGSLLSSSPTLQATGEVNLTVEDLDSILKMARQYSDRLPVEDASGSLALSGSINWMDGVPEGAFSIALDEGQITGGFGSLEGISLAGVGSLKSAGVTDASVSVLLNRIQLGQDGDINLEEITLQENLQGNYKTGALQSLLTATLERVESPYVKAGGVVLQSRLVSQGNMEGHGIDLGKLSHESGLLKSLMDDWSGTLSIQVSQARVPAGTDLEIPINELLVSADVQGGFEPMYWTISRGRAQGSGFPSLDFSAGAAMNSPLSATVELVTETINWAEIYAQWEPELPENYQAWLLDGTGTFALAGSMEWNHSTLTLENHWDATLGEMMFFSADGRTAGNGLDGRFQLQTRMVFDEPNVLSPDRQLREIEWNCQMNFGGEEILHDLFYQELSGVAFGIDWQGRWLPDEQRLSDLSLLLDFQPVGKFRIAGEVEQIHATPSVHLNILAENLEMEQAHQRFVKEGGLKDLIPVMAKWEAAGLLNADVTLSGTLDDWQAEGRIQLSEGMIGTRTDPIFLVDDFSLDLPFQLGRHKKPGDMAASEAKPAAFRYGQIFLGPLTLGGQSLPFILHNNDFRVPGEVLIPFYGGNLHVRELELSDMLSENKRLMFHIELLEVQLEPIAQDAGLPPLAGTISANLPRFDTFGGDLVGEGPARLEVFNGVVDITGMRVDRLFTGPPTIRFSADFREIDLHVLTTVLQYGRAFGIIEGYVHDFEMSHGRPRSFQAEVRSVPRRGVPQRISVDLILLITEAGRGLGPAERALLQQNEEYGYRQLGLKAQLKDDRLIMEGTAEKGGQKYIMTGSLFGGVNIQYVSPDRGVGYDYYMDYLLRQLEQLRKGQLTITR